MALLNGTRARWTWSLAAAFFLLVVAGCALIRALGPERRFAFSHARHVGEEKLDCIICHESAAVADDPGMPSPDTCQACHDELDAEKAPESQVATLFDAQQFRAAHASRIGAEPIFSHKQHVKADVACASCHDGIDDNRVVDASIAVDMARCTACHAERSLANACSTCHRELRADVAPANHAHDWIERHGRRALAHELATADSCSLCHAQASCADCHRIQAPKNHDGFFRLRGHGLFAAEDRASCAACHTPDSCAQCHEETRPLSHTGLFGGTRSQHCIACHFPLKAEGCATCHATTPSHELAVPKPAWHTPAMNCRQCHGVSAPLPHVDKGDDCNACHH
ncbi:MAG: hypothetical protein K8S98_05090 [Planctomycetes bacterium]|nr:hypothetical protein [Planctomycetota bacterium]